MSSVTPVSAVTTRPVRIGVFDSGVGGLSVLRALRATCPHAGFQYLADSRHAPYGERATDFVLARSRAAAAFLREQGCDLLVIACNTATAAAAQALREAWPDWPIVGVEPGIKPAAALTRNGRIGVLATEGTLRSDKFRLLAAAHAAHVELVLQPCPGLAAALEEGDVNAPAVVDRIAAYCAPLREQGVDTLVLGCTHYPFAAHHIQAEMGADVQLVDTAQAVARRTLQLCDERWRDAPAARGPQATPQLWTSGAPGPLGDIARRWLGLEGAAHAWTHHPALSAPTP